MDHLHCAEASVDEHLNHRRFHAHVVGALVELESADWVEFLAGSVYLYLLRLVLRGQLLFKVLSFPRCIVSTDAAL